MLSDEPQRIGKYDIVGRLGEGGMGVVYRGYDPLIRRHVALKVIRRSRLDPENAEMLIDRFRQEAQAAGNLQHANIVSIYEYGEDGDFAYIAMECVAGKSLAQHLQSGYRPELRVFPEVLDQMLDALEYSHARGVIHRDIKPSNILVSEVGITKISDFGIARLQTSNLTKLGEVLGTPNYMSPEQFLGDPVDERTDIYAAGVIVYEVLTGTRPFRGTDAQVLKQVLHDLPTPPSKIEPRLPPAADQVLLKALAKSPADRWHSAREFADALHAAFGGKPEKTRHGIKLGEATSNGSVSDATPTTTVSPAGFAALKRGLASRAKPAGSVAPAVRAGGDASRLVEEAPRAGGAVRPANASRSRHPSRPTDASRSTDASRPTDASRSTDASRPTDASRSADASRPADTARPVDASRPGGAASTGPKPRILFVDDEARILSALKSIFRDRYDIETAMSGDSALELLKRRSFHVVVSDQRMPGMQGVELLRRVRESAPKSVRLLLTGYSDLAAIVGSINEGEVYRFVSKPWDNDDLAATLREAVAVSIGLQRSAPLPEAFRVPRDRAVLVFDDDDRIYRAVRELMGGACRVLHGRTLEETVKTLAAEEIAVLVADLDIAREEVGILFRLLKQEHPQTLAIAVTRASDSELVIDLINQARLFRFVSKPINLANLKGHIVAALERYESFRVAPELVATQQAAPTPGMGESKAAGRILGRLRQFGSRFAAALKPS